MKMSHIYSNLQPPGVWVRWSKTAGTFYIYQCYHSAKKNSEHVISVSYSLRDSEWNLASAASVVKINSLIVLMPLICICCLYLRSPPHIVTHDSHKLLWTLRLRTFQLVQSYFVLAVLYDSDVSLKSLLFPSYLSLWNSIPPCIRLGPHIAL